MSGRAAWIIEDDILDILSALTDDYDIPGLKWLKEKFNRGESVSEEKKVDEISERKRRAMEQRKKMMEKMKNMQQKFSGRVFLTPMLVGYDIAQARVSKDVKKPK